MPSVPQPRGARNLERSNLASTEVPDFFQKMPSTPVSVANKEALHSTAAQQSTRTPRGAHCTGPLRLSAEQLAKRTFFTEAEAHDDLGAKHTTPRRDSTRHHTFLAASSVSNSAHTSPSWRARLSALERAWAPPSGPLGGAQGGLIAGDSGNNFRPHETFSSTARNLVVPSEPALPRFTLTAPVVGENNIPAVDVGNSGSGSGATTFNRTSEAHNINVEGATTSSDVINLAGAINDEQRERVEKALSSSDVVEKTHCAAEFTTAGTTASGNIVGSAADSTACGNSASLSKPENNSRDTATGNNSVTVEHSSVAAGASSSSGEDADVVDAAPAWVAVPASFASSEAGGGAVGPGGVPSEAGKKFLDLPLSSKDSSDPDFEEAVRQAAQRAAEEAEKSASLATTMRRPPVNPGAVPSSGGGAVNPQSGTNRAPAWSRGRSSDVLLRSSGEVNTLNTLNLEDPVATKQRRSSSSVGGASLDGPMNISVRGVLASLRSEEAGTGGAGPREQAANVVQKGFRLSDVARGGLYSGNFPLLRNSGGGLESSFARVQKGEASVELKKSLDSEGELSELLKSSKEKTSFLGRREVPDVVSGTCTSSSDKGVLARALADSLRDAAGSEVDVGAPKSGFSTADVAAEAKSFASFFARKVQGIFVGRSTFCAAALAADGRSI